jgi:hypothetical protein
MTKPLILIIDAQTGEELTREMSVAEFAQYKTDQSDAKSEQEEKANKAQAKVELLNRLGITAEEAQLLLS